MPQENSGIGANVISLPQGGGAVGGMGETFSPDLFSGTGNFSVPIAVPSGRNGLQPELTLGYSSGNGNGFFGLGWAMSIPGVSRKTSLGVPQYDDDKDIFVLSGAEDLIPVGRTDSVSEGISYRKTKYQPRTEGLFAQIFHHLKSDGTNYWEVKSKDGMVSFYGNPDPESDEHAQMRDPENDKHVAQWFLFKTVDVFGNEIRYEYNYHLVPDERAPFVQVYPKRILYADYLLNDETHYLCSVLFEYADRPDPNSAFRNGFEVRTTQRCTAIKTFTHPQENDLPDGYTNDPAGNNIAVKTYHLTYQDQVNELPSNGTSILVSVQPEGHSATEDEQMPPLSFGYTEFANDLRNFQEIKGKHLPVVNLNHPELTFADLDGNGLPDLVQASPGQPIRYWTNKGNGVFALPRSMKFSPQGLSLGDEGVQLMDADGDGRIDLVVNRPQTAGYFPLNHDGQWDRRQFIKYKQSPNFSLKTANVKMMDLTGDGRTDVLINGNRFECYFQNSPLVSDGPDEGLIREDYVAGWSGMRQVNKKSIEAFPNVNFDDPRIHTADMSGDGLQDIVEISNGRIAWWPNLGYGRFGSRRIMKKAPRFGQNFDPQRILLGDLNGDGLTDLVYLDNNKISYWVNLHGNAWGEANEIKGTPRFALGDSVQIMDLMGTGTPGILWSFERTGTQTRMYYLDLCRGVKPYVLNEMNNNMGAVTRVEYTSSVKHYMRDLYGTSVSENPGTNLPSALDLFIGSAGKWLTTLPFPTQVVNRVEVIDEISEGKLTTHYFYHHGYWDGGEREFRGFGRVDQFDSEDFNHFNETSLHLDQNFEGVSQEHYSPPMLVKNWFHLGPVGAATGEWEQLFFENEYHTSDPQVLPPSPETLQLLAGLPRRARRDAYRTLRGTALRTESYAVDGSNKQFKPYSVSETRAGLQLKDHPGNNPIIKLLANQRHSNHIFFSFTDGSRSTQWERGNDPMVSFSFSGDFDEYGQPRRALSAALPRGIMPPYTDATTEILEENGGGSILATLSLTDYADGDDETKYMVDRVCRSLNFEINPASLNVFELRDALMPASVDIAIDTQTQSIGALELEIIGCQLNYYDGNAYTGLDFGLLGDYGAVVRSETLVLTDAILNDAFGSVPEALKGTPSWGSEYPTSFQNAVPSRLGYHVIEDESFAPNGWYTQSQRSELDVHTDAQNGKGLPVKIMDPMGNLSEIEHDDYQLLPIEVTQKQSIGLDLITTAEYDYRILQAQLVTDANGNRSAYSFSPLGLMKSTSLIGKPGNSEGDDPDEAPGTFLEYDFLAYLNHQQPVWVKTTRREYHYHDNDIPAGADGDATITSIEYSDGFGRLLQTRAQAENVIFGDATFGSSGLPEDQGQNGDAVGVEKSSENPPNVVVSGWQVYDNKGQVVKKYEPYFSEGFDFQPVLESQNGQYVSMYYDPRGQVIRTVNPDGSEQRILFGDVPDVENLASLLPSPWESYTYDANDLAPITHPEDETVDSDHYLTPSSAVIDALGRTIKTIDRNGTELVVMKYEYDIRGNLVKVTDALERFAFLHKYDLKPKAGEEDSGANALWTQHIDSGEKTVLVDAAFRPVELSDAKEAKILHAYDELNRLTRFWARDTASESITLRQKLIYGDDDINGPTNPEATNHIGQVYQHYDEAGLHTIAEYDFKGNVLEKTRQIISDAEILSVFNGGGINCYRVNWETSNDSILESKEFTTNTTYDALNRPKSITYPIDESAERKILIPSFNRAGALEKVTFDDTEFVRHIAYNAKGQRILIAFGNDVMTRYAYENETFRLLRLRSETFTQDGWTFESNGNVKQDTLYEYDLTGNIIASTEKTTGCGIGGTDSMLRTFEYDALYRLLSATGRENAPTVTPIWDDAYRSHDETLTTAYTQNYHYDKMGNILKLQHQGNNNFSRIFNPDGNGDMPDNYGSTSNLLNTVKIGSTEYDFLYDDNGNLVQENADRFYEWDFADQMRCFYVDDGSNIHQYAHYLYDAAGKRVKKLVRQQNGDYDSIRYIDGMFEYRTDGTDEQSITHIMDDQSRIATVREGDDFADTTPAIKYMLEDHLGSSVVEMASSGANVNREEYYPFGETSFGSYAKKRYKFCGKERDHESGMYYYGARYYSAWICRFVSVDPEGASTPQFSSYTYTNNKPINYKDINGLQSSEIATNDKETGNDSNGNIEGLVTIDPNLIPTKPNIRSKSEIKADIKSVRKNKDLSKSEKSEKIDNLKTERKESINAQKKYKSEVQTYESLLTLKNELINSESTMFQEFRDSILEAGKPIELSIKSHADSSGHVGEISYFYQGQENKLGIVYDQEGNIEQYTWDKAVISFNQFFLNNPEKFGSKAANRFAQDYSGINRTFTQNPTRLSILVHEMGHYVYDVKELLNGNIPSAEASEDAAEEYEYNWYKMNHKQ